MSLKNKLGSVSTKQKKHSRVYLKTFGRTTGLRVLGLFCLRGGLRVYERVLKSHHRHRITYSKLTKINIDYATIVEQFQQLFHAWKANCKLRTNISAGTIIKMFIRL